MTPFFVGDRVECVVNYPDDNPHIHIGSLGIVCREWKSGTDTLGVRWDDYVEGNNCNGTCEQGHGWFVYSYQIKLCEEDEDAEDINEDSFLKLFTT